jgi:hypothetical protein
MTYQNGKTQGMKWTMTIVASVLLAVSTVYRMAEGEEADSGLCWVFISIAGLIYGAKIIEYFKK